MRNYIDETGQLLYYLDQCTPSVGWLVLWLFCDFGVCVCVCVSRYTAHARRYNIAMVSLAGGVYSHMR